MCTATARHDSSAQSRRESLTLHQTGGRPKQARLAKNKSIFLDVASLYFSLSFSSFLFFLSVCGRRSGLPAPPLQPGQLPSKHTRGRFVCRGRRGEMKTCRARPGAAQGGTALVAGPGAAARTETSRPRGGPGRSRPRPRLLPALPCPVRPRPAAAVWAGSERSRCEVVGAAMWLLWLVLGSAGECAGPRARRCLPGPGPARRGGACCGWKGPWCP